MTSDKTVKASPGVYYVCFDNTHAKYTAKTVYFQIDVKDNSLKKEELIENKQRIEFIDETLSDILTLTNNYRVREAKSRSSFIINYYLFSC